MTDIFQSPHKLYSSFREFCSRISPDLGSVFERDFSQWDPHIMLLLNGLLYVGDSLEQHNKQRTDEFLQQLAYHYTPGEVVARPGAHLLHFDAGINEFREEPPGIYPKLPPFSVVQNDDREDIGHLGDEGFTLTPGFHLSSIDMHPTPQGWQLHLDLVSELPLVEGPLPNLRFFLADSMGDASYKFLDLLYTPGLRCLAEGVTVRHSPQRFSSVWSSCPWYREHYRYCNPYPEKLDLFFEIEGLTHQGWSMTDDVYRRKLVLQFPPRHQLDDTTFVHQLHPRCNVAVLFSYVGNQDMMVNADEQRPILFQNLETSPRSKSSWVSHSDRVMWLRAWRNDEEVFQPGTLYLGDLLEDSLEELWTWRPADESPMVVELRQSDVPLRVECLRLRKLVELDERNRLLNCHYPWDASLKKQKAYTAACVVRRVAEEAEQKRLGPEDIRKNVWTWLHRHFRLSQYFDRGEQDGSPSGLEEFVEAYLEASGVGSIAEWDRLSQSGYRESVFSHVPGRGLVPSASLQMRLPAELSYYDLGSAARGLLLTRLRRFMPFLQERLPPQLRLLVSLVHADHEQRPWMVVEDR